MPNELTSYDRGQLMWTMAAQLAEARTRIATLECLGTEREVRLVQELNETLDDLQLSFQERNVVKARLAEARTLLSVCRRTLNSNSPLTAARVWDWLTANPEEEP